MNDEDPVVDVGSALRPCHDDSMAARALVISVRVTLDIYVAASSERDRAAAESVAAMYDIG